MARKPREQGAAQERRIFERMHDGKLAHATSVDEAQVARAIAAATAVRDHAYAPYSRFKVGAALVTAAGSMHVGCNVENASYGLTQCAERAAITAATAAGRRDVIMCIIVTDTTEPTTPCGACRQVLAETGMDMLVICRTLAGAERRFTLNDLLPDAFLTVEGA